MSDYTILFAQEAKEIELCLWAIEEIKRKMNLNVLAVCPRSEGFEEAISKGIDEIIELRSKLNNEQYSSILEELVKDKKPRYIIALSNNDNNDIIARVCGAFLLRMFTDVSEFELRDKETILRRKVFGGKAICEISLPIEESLALTISAKKIQPSLKTSPKITVFDAFKESRVSILSFEPKKTSGIDISEAEIVIGVGRGFKKQEDIKLAEELASLINAQVGASRPIAADYKWLPEDRWIGISGKIIRPKLYIAIGISGAPQHIGGILESRIIVAIDKDKNAPIFKYADYCVVADLYEFIPALIQAIKKRKVS